MHHHSCLKRLGWCLYNVGACCLDAGIQFNSRTLLANILFISTLAFYCTDYAALLDWFRFQIELFDALVSEEPVDIYFFCLLQQVSSYMAEKLYRIGTSRMQSLVMKLEIRLRLSNEIECERITGSIKQVYTRQS